MAGWSNTDYLHNRTKNSTIYGFKGGPIGFLKCKYVHLSHEFVYPYRNQVMLQAHSITTFFFVKR